MSTDRPSSAAAKQRIMGDLKQVSSEKWVRVDVDETNLFRWQLALMVVNPDSAFNGGYLKAEMLFPHDYPYSPPKFRFLKPIFHPNIYPDGQLCISILHKPGEDLMSGESATERWSPLQGAESVLRSILLLLDDPEINSPANVDAGVMYRDHRKTYNERARKTVGDSQKDIPKDFVMPTTLEPEAPPQKAMDDDWLNESEEEFDWEASGSDDDIEDAEDEEDDL
ncbi:hypothetical protein Daus18300_008511 [Diaporthe australafricana]|uniref:Ubiquitin-conjugating enzyme E2 2 n=1 Tax=Diaporthe australafricana TaxID=127596 RepID=A0ABR3WHV5_9PEZI